MLRAPCRDSSGLKYIAFCVNRHRTPSGLDYRFWWAILGQTHKRLKRGIPENRPKWPHSLGVATRRLVRGPSRGAQLQLSINTAVCASPETVSPGKSGFDAAGLHFWWTRVCTNESPRRSTNSLGPRRRNSHPEWDTMDCWLESVRDLAKMFEQFLIVLKLIIVEHKVWSKNNKK